VYHQTKGKKYRLLTHGERWVGISFKQYSHHLPINISEFFDVELLMNSKGESGESAGGAPGQCRSPKNIDLSSSYSTTFQNGLTRNYLLTKC